MRTTHATKANDTSSRSHAITQIKIQEEGVKQCGAGCLPGAKDDFPHMNSNR